LATLLFCSASASAAGPPEAYGPFALGSFSTINVEQAEAIIEPNGAATTYKLEYGLTEKLGTTVEGTLSGEEKHVLVRKQLSGILAGATYHYRFSATNSYGTAYSSMMTFHANKWFGTGVTWPSTYVSGGSFTFEIPGKSAVIPCTESGYGSIGSGNAATDSITMEFSGCSVTGAPACKVEPFTMKLNGGLTAALTFLNITGAECGLGGWKIGLTPTLTNSYHGTAEVAPSYTFAGGFQFGAWVGYIKGSSTWELSGANRAKAFRWKHEEE